MMWILLSIIVLLICEGLYLAARVMALTEDLHEARKHLHEGEERQAVMRHNLQVVMEAHARLAGRYSLDDPYRYERDYQARNGLRPKNQEGTNDETV